MSQWLVLATELVVAKSPSELADRFIETIRSELGLEQCLLLVPTTDGRSLVPHGRDVALSWSVTDFDCPFAHVLQSARPINLAADELGFWRLNRAFNELTAQVGLMDKVAIHPLPVGADQVQSVLFMVGESRIVDGLFTQPEFIKFLEIFSHQWSLLSEILRENQGRKVLSESLNDAQRDDARRCVMTQLSTKLIGDSSAMHKLREQIINAASSKLSVMIQGETGTGKELVAHAVHEYSSRNKGPFVAINCAAIPENLLESELFGYSKGAFSGADKDKLGLIAQADGGTLFLDEIGDMPLNLQAKLLRVLESRLFRPVGAKQELTSNFRLVSATHVNLLQQVRQREFRQDLYYRLLQYPVSLPSLSAKLEDIELLSQHFVDSFNHQHNTNIRGLDYKAIDRLSQYDFPGNVRELKHLVEFACAQTPDGTQVAASCFEHRLSNVHSVAPSAVKNVSNDTAEYGVGFNSDQVDNLKQTVNEFELRIIRDRLQHFSGDRAKAAASLGIPKRTLAYKCQKLEIKTP
ncbi:sigma-54 dependent transcriptional regulator [Vibrio ichthyoenteri ATCC 700023]|uniref:Sigma-54 dependent transcriptional regulator n=1 Tax=Vibrio ichthyoenteri ATCC 700023 TaxID=870968 RepID=F9S033_9VIBR|nr:sigma-54 dependent transcriptional regulator [Vibrio ichthyoenteri]EGU43901.1 sigma-54 dependent transcriptional regulator [Vibrio ichthyoenteri ATCC 700023]